MFYYSRNVSVCDVACMQSVNERFFMFDEIETDAIFSMDDNIELITDEVSSHFSYSLHCETLRSHTHGNPGISYRSIDPILPVPSRNAGLVTSIPNYRIEKFRRRLKAYLLTQ